MDVGICRAGTLGPYLAVVWRDACTSCAVLHSTFGSACFVFMVTHLSLALKPTVPVVGKRLAVLRAVRAHSAPTALYKHTRFPYHPANSHLTYKNTCNLTVPQEGQLKGKYDLKGKKRDFEW